MNTVMLVGTVYDEPKTVDYEGKPVTYFSLSCQRYKKTKMVINCVAWNGASVIVKNHVEKGMLIGITGSLNTRFKRYSEGSMELHEVLVHKVFKVDPEENEDSLEFLSEEDE